jgi:hypothetical protein
MLWANSFFEAGVHPAGHDPDSSEIPTGRDPAVLTRNGASASYAKQPRDGRRNFRLGWNVTAAICDVGQHPLSRGAKIAGVGAHASRVIWRAEEALRVEFTDLDGDGSSGRPLQARSRPTPDTAGDTEAESGLRH